jgi:GT2 family glycosyltransferase
MMRSPLVAVVLLNWNGWQDTINCIQSLLESRYSNYVIVVVDNASTDDSANKIGMTFAENNKIKLIRNDHNSGYAAGNNIGIRDAIAMAAEYVFVLNNDTTVDVECLGILVTHAENNPECDLIGPKIYDWGTRIYRQWAVKERLNLGSLLGALSPLRRLIYHSFIFRSFFHTADQQAVVYAIPGSAMFFRTRTIDAVGLFDEFTFLYWEEFIIAEKLRQIDAITCVVPAAVIWHRESASITKIGARKFIENVKSERYFYRQYLKLNFLSQVIINLVRLFAYLARCLVDHDYREKLKPFLGVYFGRVP